MNPLNASKSVAKRLLPTHFLTSYRLRKYGRFKWLKMQTEGLMSPNVYEAIYERFCGIDGGDVIEVGGASGAATIAIAWALQDGGGGGRVVVVEKFEGGTRAKYGGFQNNLNRFEEFLRMFKVADRVVPFPDYLTLERGTEVLELVSSPQVGGLLLDADGHIHRDFALFWDRLGDLSPIIIDDYHPDLSPKHAITHRLLTKLLAWNLVTLEKVVEGTFFGCKGPARSLAVLDMEECQEVINDVCCEHRVVFDQRGITSVVAEDPWIAK